MIKSEISDLSRINLTDDKDQIINKIKKAKTDPMPMPKTVLELEERLEAKNLIGIYASLTNSNIEKSVERFIGKNFSEFKEKLSEQLCVLADGPCTYSGDSMEQVHTGMNISESEFNKGVDLFINAMDKANIPHTLQNRLLKEMAKTRSQMIYR